jgi:hypothetical protein
MEINLFKVGYAAQQPGTVQDSFLIEEPSLSYEPTLVETPPPPVRYPPQQLPEDTPQVPRTESTFDVSVFDLKSSAPLGGWALTLYDSGTKEIFSQVQASNADTFFSLTSAGYDPATLYIEISHPGYKTALYEFSQLEADPRVWMERSTNMVPILLALGALAIFATKRRKQVGAVTVSDVMPFLLIGGGILAFSLVKKMLEFLGIWDSQATHNLNDASTDPGSFWNPNFWQLKPTNAPWTYLITEATAGQWCQEIYDALGPVNDDEEAVISVFKRCRTQANASFICWKFDKMYGEDLLQWLRGGWWPQDRLSDADVNKINTYISNLPKY